MKYIKGLDVLRAFAVLLVIKEHWGLHIVKSESLSFIFDKIVPSGKFGVDLFFVLSGFLITGILLNATCNEPPLRRLDVIKAFYIRRILRIFPIYFLFIIIVGYLLTDEFVKTHIWYFVTYTSNFLFFKLNTWGVLSHTWSLAVEEQFYLIWPWVIIYTPKKYLLWIILLFICVGFISGLIFNHLFGSFSDILLLPCFTAFAIGAFYAYIKTYPNHQVKFDKGIMILLPACIAILLFHQIVHGLIWIRAINSLIAVSLIIIASKEKSGWASALFKNRLLIGIGKISYGIYLIHYVLPQYYFQLIQYLERKHVMSNSLYQVLNYIPVAYLINMTLLLSIAYLSFRFIETPFLNLKRYFTYTGAKVKVGLSDYA